MINFERIIDFSKGDKKQFLVLVRHFFLRLFQNDVVSFEEAMQEKVIAILAILTVFAAHLSYALLMKYLFIPDEGTSWVEKCYFISFFMVLMGFIVVLEWDLIFLDSRDYSNLMPLPIKLRTIFTAKFASLCLFIGLFSLSINSLATFVFFVCLPGGKSSSLIYGLRFIITHLISVFSANFFIFFSSLLFMGILMDVLNYRIFRRISVYIRATLMIFFVFMMIFFLTESVSVPQAFSSFPTLKKNDSLFLYLFPPMWFTGLYESLLGNHDPLFFRLSKISLLSIIVSVLAFFIVAAIGYKRHLKRMHEVKKRTLHLFKLKTFLTGIFNSIFLRNPVQKAIFYFFGKTLIRSIIHKMRLAAYLTVSVGLILIILASRMSRYETLSEANKTLLSIPLILSFFLLVGLRVVVNIPATLDANWIFKLTEMKQKRHYFSGLRKGIFFFILAPLFFLLFVFYFFLWGWENAFLHCFYGLVVSTLLMEVLFLKYSKIPFACSYLPGKTKIQYLWPIYLLSFLSYVFLMSFIEYELLKMPSKFLIFYGVVFLLFLIIKVYQKYFLYKKIEIIYEEEPEPVMVTLSLSN